MASTLVKSIMKLGVCGGALYATATQGVWTTDNKVGAKLYSSVRHSIQPDDEKDAAVSMIFSTVKNIVNPRDKL